MKNRPIISFLTFSAYTSPESVTRLLETHHKTWSSRFDHWSLQSTQKRLEGGYWNTLVWTHFMCLVALLLSAAVFISTQVHLPGWQLGAGLLVVLVVLYQLLKTMLYKPHYELHFLPLLSNAVQHLSGEAKDSISKAKSGQYKTFTLLLIQYVFQKLSGCSKLSDGNIQRELLCKQYGISNDTLDAPLKNLLSKPYQEQKMKMRTMMQDYFDEARNYFELLNCKPALALLQEMEQSLHEGKKLPF